MKRAAGIAGAVLLAGAWALAAGGHGITGHMLAHMTAVAVAAPLLAVGMAGTALDPAARWPQVVGPVQMSLAELAVVWGWHVPAARALAATSALGLALEQATFAAAGVLLWSACLGARDAASSARRAIAIVALLLTTMHMTLLGALIALAPRVLYATHAVAPFALGGVPAPLGGVHSPLEDQHLAGVVMLLVGGGSYLTGGVWLLARLLRGDALAAAGRWS